MYQELTLKESDLRDFNGTPLKIGDSVIYAQGTRHKTLKVGAIILGDDKRSRWCHETRTSIEYTENIICVRGEKGYIYNIREFLTQFNEVSNLFLVKYAPVINVLS